MPIEVDGVRIEVSLTRKRVKNVNARLVGRCLHVSAPPHLDEESLTSMIKLLARRLLRRGRAREINGEDAAADIARRVAAAFPSPPRVTSVEFVTTQTRRWGSYSTRTGAIRINAALLSMPRWVLEAVVAHELAHSFHPHHGPAFHALLRAVCGASERASAFLAGVSWLAGRWSSLSPVDRTLLCGVDTPGEDDGGEKQNGPTGPAWGGHQ